MALIGSSVWIWTVALAAPPTGGAGEIDFARDVAPVLARRCLSCHNEVEKKGGLSLETAEGTRVGGESGPVVVPGKPGESSLIELIRPAAGQAEMPKNGDPLAEAEIEAIARWIEEGAVRPDGLRLEAPKVESTDWWSLQPIAPGPIPAPAAEDAAWAESPIDAFLAAARRERGLDGSPPADRRTLIRRLSFDLVGLPPEFEAVEAFERDAAPDAYERLVDRLLASPAHGERWARHWLDVVHFGETHGYDKDKPRPHAWPYRDYVIRAFNEDKPYRRFVQEQIAGDVLFPHTRDGIEALGFLSAGPWDFIGHAELPESKIDGKVARHLDRDDMVSNAIGAFCSVTVHCAQCHNHKFDPVTQRDYYALQAVFAALDRADREYDLDPGVSRRRAELNARRRSLAARRDALAERVRELCGEELRRLDEAVAAAEKLEIPSKQGYHSGIESSPDETKWVQVDLGRPVALERIELVAAHDDFNGIGAGFGFPPRYRVELADEPDFEGEVFVVADRSAADEPNPKSTPVVLPTQGRAARFVRVTATRLAARQDDYIFALAELSAWDVEGRNVARGASVRALDSIESPERWSTANLVDGVHPRQGTSEARRAQLLGEREALVRERVPAQVLEAQKEVEAGLAAVQGELALLPRPQTVYVGSVYTGSGNFIGTGGAGGRPRPVYLLARGDVTKPGEEISPGALAAVAPLDGNFHLSESHAEGDRRAALAAWLIDDRHPLTWRSIVNRIWLYHFGRGVVDTPSDFGRMGQPPTHPELLDWLAAEFRDEGGSLKRLHRLLATSAAYRQSSADRPSMSAKDAENRYLWRSNRRRLEAEAVRDSILWAAGRLDRSMGGPSFQDFVVEKPEHSPHYEYRLHDPEDPRSHRRSIYRFLVRSQQHPFMATMDCADPSMFVDKRGETISPLQALALLNNPLTTAMAHHFSERVASRGDGAVEQIGEAFRIALGRNPSRDDLDALSDYARRRGMANACRLILNMNEFVFVD